jgi:hypothetical protein
VNTTIAALITVAVIVAGIPCTAAAQNQRQLEQKYPKVNAYAVRPNILLTAQYASDGQVCEMVLEPRRWTEEKVVLVSTLSENETIPVVEEVVPESERGKRLKTPLGDLSAVAGGSITTTHAYQNITIDFVGSTGNGGSHDMVVGYMVAVVKWRNRSCQ